MLNNCLIASESVSEGHPDKIADKISDAILDYILEQDKHAHVACETLVKKNIVIIAGETKTTKPINNIEKIVRDVIVNIGYDTDELGFNGNNCKIINIMSKQSSEITSIIKKDNSVNQGAGDQGIVVGFANNDTSVLMPAPIFFAHKLMQRQALLRKRKVIPWLRPDAKSQVILKYKNNKPIAVKTVIVSTQHSPDITHNEIKDTIIEEIVKPTFPKEWLSNTKYLINPAGSFIIGGPTADCGLTGRKIVVDTYGNFAPHGGGCFSGKDPSKVDRSGAYMGRYIAKNIVAVKLATSCEIQISYIIGATQPSSIFVNTFGTGKISDRAIENKIRKTFDMSPYAVIKKLNLLKPIYKRTSNYGHFGREEKNFSWENTNDAHKLLEN